MASVHLCDGCGARIEGEPEERGFVLRRDYCSTCAAKADEYQRELDALHDAVADRWQKGRQRLVAKHGRTLDALPDVESPA